MREPGEQKHRLHDGVVRQFKHLSSMRRITTIQHECRLRSKILDKLRDFAQGFQVDRLIDKIVQKSPMKFLVVPFGNFQQTSAAAKLFLTVIAIAKGLPVQIKKD